MMNREQLLAEIARLDKKRQPGDWRSQGCDIIGQEDGQDILIGSADFPDAAFIALAPKMATLIRDFQKREELLVKILTQMLDDGGFVKRYDEETDEPVFDVEKSDGGSYCQAAADWAIVTLMELKTNDWMDDE